MTLTAMFLMIVAASAFGEGPNDESRVAGDVVNEPQVTIPERQIQFVESPEVYPMELFRADPKLLEQRYVAIISFRYPQQPNRNDLWQLLPEDVRELAFYGGQSILSPFASTPNFRGRGSTYFGQLVKIVSKENLPPEDAGNFFLENADLGYVQFQEQEGFGGRRRAPAPPEAGYFHFRIIAPTADRAKQLATALVTLLDHGFSRRAQISILSLREAATAWLSQEEAARDKVKKELDEYQKQLESPVEVTAKQLEDLKTQRNLLEVELAGVEARIKASARILDEGRPLDSSHILQVENIKITAEIELAGLVGRQKTLSAIIEKGEKRAALEFKWRKANETHSDHVNRVSEANRIIAHYDEALVLLRPFELQDNTIVIRPIQWGQSDNR
jgi:hypothetical protein